MKKYVFHCYSDEKGLGEEKIFDTAKDAVSYGRREWNHLTKGEQKKNYIDDPCGEFRVFEIEISEEDLKTYADSELDSVLSDFESGELWDALSDNKAKGVKFIGGDILDLGFSIDRKRLQDDITEIFNNNHIPCSDDPDDYDYIENPDERFKEMDRIREIWLKQDAAKEEICTLIDAGAGVEILIKKICGFLDLIEAYNDRDPEGIDRNEKCVFKDLAMGLEFVRPEAVEVPEE